MENDGWRTYLIPYGKEVGRSCRGVGFVDLGFGSRVRALLSSWVRRRAWLLECGALASRVLELLQRYFLSLLKAYPNLLLIWHLVDDAAIRGCQSLQIDFESTTSGQSSCSNLPCPEIVSRCCTPRLKYAQLWPPLFGPIASWKSADQV